jgi:hypothetical protein
VREDDPLAREAREPHVREGREWLLAPGHALERPQSGLEAGAVVRSDRGDILIRERGCRLFRFDAAERLRVLVEREQRDNR